MDAEKFDKVVLDLLYDELDELTRASAIRHMEQSGKAKALYSELRATREVGALPLVEPPDDLEQRILDAEERARAGRPLPQRIGTLVSIVASYAMRPQLGMAAVLLLMVGSSLLLLRVKPGEPSSVQVTERGVPESDKETAALPPRNAPVPSRADDTAAQHAAPKARTNDLARAEPATEERPADKEEAAPFPGAPEGLALHAAKRSSGALDEIDRSSLYGRGDDVSPPAAAAPAAGAGAGTAFADDSALSGGGPVSEPEKTRDDCVVTLPRYETALSRAASQIERNRARWGAAECYARLGRVESARKTYTALLTAPAYADRARAALAALPDPSATSTVAQAAPAEAKAAAKPAATQPAASASAAPNTSATTEH